MNTYNASGRWIQLVGLQAGLAGLLSAQEIRPVWVQHVNLPNNALPILRKADAPTERADGTSGFDNYAAFVRYDANRLLLGVRENGIDETSPTLSAADRALAEAYPDRSLIWINPTNGAPMGLALKTPVFPVELAAGSQASPNDFFWNWGVSDGPEGTRAVYTGYKNVILRWAPLPGGGWSTTPTTAWIEPVPGVGDESSGGDGSNSWRWRTFRVEGSGTNTVIYAGGGTWRQSMHVQKFATVDGVNFTPVARVNDRDGGIKQRYSWSGMNTKAVKYAGDPSRPNLELFFSPSFPAAGRELKPRRFSRNPDSPYSGSFTEPVPGNRQSNRNNFFDPDNAQSGALPAFSWEGPERPFPSGTEYYDGNWSFAMDTAAGLDYLVNYSGPSWNNQYGPDERRPGWLGIHRLSGKIASGQSSYKLDFNEVTEATLDNANVGNSYTYDANVNVYADPASPAGVQRSEVLWAGGSFGFGRFVVENVPATLVASPASTNVAAGASVTLTATVTGSPNEFQWYRNGVPLVESSYHVGVDKPALTLVGATAADAGSYQLRWVNPLSGAGQTAPATVTVTGSFTRWTAFSDIAKEAPPVPSEIVTNAASFTIRASGLAAFDNADNVGDTIAFRRERITGDFDRAVRLVGLSVEGTSETPSLSRAGLQLRASEGFNTPVLEIAAYNPDGANLVRVAGRGRVDQVYSKRLSRDYPGVSANLPNQWLRIRRTGDAFAFFVSANGTTWSLVAEQYQSFPATVFFGTFAAPDDASGSLVAVAEFANYGPPAVTDTTAPVAVSAGTLDGRTVGVKFSEPVSTPSATDRLKYTLSQGTVLSVRPGISGDTVYLTVAGLTASTFTVSVSGVVDLHGNPVAATTLNARRSAWTSTDIGYIQDPVFRPTLGDDPYVAGSAVAVSSDTNPEVEIVGGGSNGYNPGDYIHYLYRPYTGDFDVVVAIDRFDRRGIAGGYANGGIHVRAGLYLPDNTEIGANTKVPSYVNIAYYEGSDPNRAAIELNRPAAGDNYGNSGPYSNDTLIGSLRGFFTDLRTVDAAGTISPESDPTQAKWIRVKRTGQSFTSYFSYDGMTWVEQEGSTRTMANLPATVLVGFGHHNDTGYGVPPAGSTYAGNGTVNAEGAPVQNESNYGVVRIRNFGDLATAFPVESPLIQIRRTDGSVVLSWTGTGFTLQSSASLDGTYSATGLTPVVSGDVSTVTIAPTESGRFYRLVR